MFDFYLNEARDTVERLTRGAMTDRDIILKEVQAFETSRRRQDMLTGERYYRGEHDILTRRRTVIGERGELEEVQNLPNNKIVDNQYKKLVDQKTNYLLGKPITVQTERPAYSEALSKIMNRAFLRTMKNIGEDALNCGVGWLFLHYNEAGELVCRRMRPQEIVAGWRDAEHTILEYAIRFYDVLSYEGKEEKRLKRVEVYDDRGITFFERKRGELIPVPPYHQSYITMQTADGKQTGYNWAKIPLIPFKYNAKEIPLIRMVKPLQDGLNLIESNFQNSMEEDTRNTILVLMNYDGENLGEFRRNLAQYGAVKVRTVDGAGGDLKSLQVEVNSENYKAILQILKKAILENGMGFDAKDDRLGGNPNQMNIQSMYADIDLDANNMETEFLEGFDQFLWFLNCHLQNTGAGDFTNEKATVILNRDILINEGEAIENCQKSIGILSDETITANHPWVTDVGEELKRLAKQKQEEREIYDPFKDPPQAIKDEQEDGKA